MSDVYDAVVVGSGPNGLAAAITLARNGLSVLVVEAADAVGGGMRTKELTLPGFAHDVCSAIHPMVEGSPFLGDLPLLEHGLRLAHPEIPLGHAITPEQAVFAHRDIAETAAGLGADAMRYRVVMSRMVESWPLIRDHVLGPIVRFPDHPVALGRFGIAALRPATRSGFSTTEARALFAGNAAHAFLPLDRPLTSSFGYFLLIAAHRYGWPAVVGGSGRLAEALSSVLTAHGGVITTGWQVETLDELPPHKLVLLDVGPSEFAKLAGRRLPAGYHRKVTRFHRGPAAFKIDYALSAPVPWHNPDLARAGTVHVGGTLGEVAASERAAWNGEISETPFMLVVQPTLFDPTRAPTGMHTLWVYGHVPHGSDHDFTPIIERRMELFAPGFADTVLARRVTTPSGLESYNRNYVGGDITGGAHTLPQLVFRPFPARDPYSTPIDGVFLCSSSTPPGAGTHGMCGYRAATSALRWIRR